MGDKVPKDQDSLTESSYLKNRKFEVEAVVKRIVTDTVSLIVSAVDSNEAADKTRDVLQMFPSEHSVPGVSYCFIDNRLNGDVSVLSVNVKE